MFDKNSARLRRARKTRAKIRESLDDLRPSLSAVTEASELRARMAAAVQAVDEEN